MTSEERRKERQRLAAEYEEPEKKATKKAEKKEKAEKKPKRKGNAYTLHRDVDVLSTGANPAPIIHPEPMETVEDAGKPTIEEIRTRIDDAIEEYKDEAERRAGFDRKKPIEADTWMAICKYVGWKVFDGKGLLQAEKRTPKDNAPFIYDRVEAIYKYYEYLTNLTRAVVRVCDFAAFIYTSEKVLYESRTMVTPSGCQLAKRISKDSEDGYAAKLASRSANTTGIAMILNVRYGWTQSREVVHTDGAKRLTAAELPKLGANADN